ncbi:hypothetical protein [Burkholderia paludis]|uniref:hypothetical protein n=1 Tax=Burkholderia paludis TaxID=1506587 RepID=UPI00068E6627|nr:hypothetical protein [Burkholderia paludis]
MHPHLSRVVPDDPRPTHSDLSSWEATIREAVGAERDGRITPALAGYRRALEIAQRLIETPPPSRHDDCVAALVVSWHNLADLLASQGDVERCVEGLCDAHEALIALYLDARRDALLRRAALRHGRETHLALVRHMARHGEHPRIVRALREGSLALDVGSAVRH